MTNTIKAVIFDMGGVLLRTVDPLPRINLAERFNTSKEELESVIFMSETSKLSEVGEISDKQHWEAVFQHFNQQIDDYLLIYNEYFSGDAIDKDLLSFAVSLKPEHKVGLLSNAWVNSRPLLGARFDFLAAFDVSVFSYEVGCRKPDPQIFHEILKKMNVSAEESLFVDDFSANVDGAKAIGMQAIHFVDRLNAISVIEAMLK